MSQHLNFLSRLTGSFATPAAENPTVAMIEAAYRHHQLDARYINCWGASKSMLVCAVINSSQSKQ